MPSWACALSPVVEHVARILSSASPYDVSVPAVLTRDKHKAAARRRVNGPGTTTDRVESTWPEPWRPSSSGQAAPAGKLAGPTPATEPSLPRLWRDSHPFEEEHASTRRSWCDGCLPDRRAEVDGRMRAAPSAAAERHRDETGVLPSHTEQAQARRKDAIRRRELARRVWKASHGGMTPDVEWYQHNIAPKLGELTLTEIAGALGVSTSSASKFRRGLRVPSPHRWTALAELVGVQPQ